VSGLFAPEQIAAREADASERRVAQAACEAIPFEGPLYARVDMIRDGGGEPVVLELELTEPSFYLAYAPGAAQRFAGVLTGRPPSSS
jgi:O-ureido-D-serine cyclo-ligase